VSVTAGRYARKLRKLGGISLGLHLHPCTSSGYTDEQVNTKIYEPKYSDVTPMLLQLGVPSFNTVLHNAKLGFYTR